MLGLIDDIQITTQRAQVVLVLRFRELFLSTAVLRLIPHCEADLPDQ